MWTKQNLEELDQAIASGAQEIWFSDKKIKYNSLEDMLRVRAIILEAIGLSEKQNRVTVPLLERGI